MPKKADREISCPRSKLADLSMHTPTWMAGTSPAMTPHVEKLIEPFIL
jgi:hypothetical protein